MNFSKALNKPFTDMKKLVIGILLSMFPIIRWFAKGYILECSDVKNKKSSNKMPEWKNIFDYFVKGFMATLISIIYMIPVILVSLFTALGFILYLVNVYVGHIIPRGMLEQVFLGNVPAEQLALIIQQNWTPIIPALVNFTPVAIFIGFLAILAYYLIPIATLNYIKTGKLENAFKLRNIGKKAFTSDYFTVWIITVIVTIILTMLLAWIPVFGFGASFFIAGVFSYTLFGEVYKRV